MKTYELNNGTGFIELPATIKKIVAHFKDEHTEEMELFSFLVLKPSIKKKIAKIDCYDNETNR